MTFFRYALISESNYRSVIYNLVLFSVLTFSFAIPSVLHIRSAESLDQITLYKG
jgi:hypothetical protein